MSSGVQWRSSFILAALGFVAASIAAPDAARAQNLVQNPKFLNGLVGYNTMAQVNVKTTQNPNLNIAVLTPGAVLTQSIATNIDMLYTVSFFADFVNRQNMRDILFASFGDGGVTLDSAQGTPAGIFSFMATAHDTNAILRFAEGGGANVITLLDVEPAPVPVPGAGGLSMLIGVAALIGVGLRRRLKEQSH